MSEVWNEIKREKDIFNEEKTEQHDLEIDNMEIGGNDEQLDIDIGLVSMPGYTKYYEPGL